MALQEFGTNIWIADGPKVSFFGFPYPTRMAVIKLSNGSGSWIWSPIALTDDIVADVENKAGPVRHIVSPNKIHHIFLKQWSDRYPDAKVYASPGLQGRKVVKDVKFDAALADEADPAYTDDIDQVILGGSAFMDEVVFFHRQSKTALFCDLIQRFPEEEAKGFNGAMMKMDGLVGEKGSTPREWRLTFLFGKDKARAARDRVLGWSPDRLVIAHGHCAKEGAADIISQALSWI